MGDAEVDHISQEKINSFDLSKMLGEILFEEILEGFTYRDFLTYGNTGWVLVEEIKDAK